MAGKMIILKTERDLEAMRPACEVTSTILEEVAAFIQPGLTTREVDDYAAARMRVHGAKSAFLNYRHGQNGGGGGMRRDGATVDGRDGTVSV